MVQDFTSRPMIGLTPEEIEHRPFSPVKKGGVDEAAVRAFLREVASFVEQQESQARAREEALERQISELRNRAAHPEMPTGQKLVELVGEEVARTLRTAQESADEMRRKAEERALRIVRDAQDEAHRVRDEQLEAANHSGRAIVEAARERGREMVGEARSLRERVLADLNRRREALQEQLQGLRGGREELAATYRALKQVYDESATAFARFESNRPFDAISIDVPPPPLLPPERPEPLEQRAEQPREETREETRAGALEIGELPRADVVEAALVEVPETEAEAEAAAPAEPAAPETAAASEPEPEPAPAPEPEPAPEPAPERKPEPRPAAAAPKPAPAPRPSAPSSAPAGEPGSGPSTPDLDEIFKRIRAGRIGDTDQRPSGPSAQAAAGEPARAATATATATRSATGPATRTLTIPATAAAPEPEPEVQPEPPAEPVPEAAADHDGVALRQRDEALATVQVELARAAKRALQDEQNELLDALRRQRRGVALEKVLPPLVDQVATWSAVLSPTLDRVYIEARAHTTGEPPAAATAPRRLVASMAEMLVTPMRERVTAAITEAPDPDPDAIAQRIGARYREWKGQELEARVGDVLAATYARGVYDAAPEGARLRWVPERQGKCSDCDDNALEPTVRGERFPTGQPFPPAHPGCRCSLEVMP